MPAAIELPDFVTRQSVERTYRRSMQMRAKHKRRPSGYTREWRARGVRAARDRNPKLLLWLEKGAGIMRAMNDEQRSRFGANESDVVYREQDYTEFSTFKEAMLLADEKLRTGEPGDPDHCDPEVFGWFYGACAEAVFGPL